MLSQVMLLLLVWGPTFKNHCHNSYISEELLVL
jgi:hypothetical protein